MWSCRRCDSSAASPWGATEGTGDDAMADCGECFLSHRRHNKIRSGIPARRTGRKQTPGETEPPVGHERGSRHRPSTPIRCGEEKWRVSTVTSIGGNKVRESWTGSEHNDLGCSGYGLGSGSLTTWVGLCPNTTQVKIIINKLIVSCFNIYANYMGRTTGANLLFQKKKNVLH
jgi:hypothetical protein